MDREPIVRKEPESVGALICQVYQMFPVLDTVLQKSKHQLVFSHIQLVDTKLLQAQTDGHQSQKILDLRRRVSKAIMVFLYLFLQFRIFNQRGKTAIEI